MSTVAFGESILSKNCYRNLLTYRFAPAMETSPDILSLKRVAAKVVLKLVHFDQKNCCTIVAQKLLSNAKKNRDLLKTDMGI